MQQTLVISTITNLIDTWIWWLNNKWGEQDGKKKILVEQVNDLDGHRPSSLLTTVLAIVRWHRTGFCIYWRLISRSPETGRKEADSEGGSLLLTLSGIVTATQHSSFSRLPYRVSTVPF